MIFDLQGRRRRAVQATYLTLAVLMGAGFVLFGIGGEVSGGLFDAFSGDGKGGGGDSAIEKRVETAQARLERNPRDEAALRDLARAEFLLAGQETDPNSESYGPEAKDNLARAASAWERYLALAPAKPDVSLAQMMLQVYDPAALNRPAQAVRAAEIVAEAKPSAAAYLRLMQYATLAQQTRKADLAGQKAVDLASKGQRKTVQAQIAQFKAAAAKGSAAAQGQAPAPAGSGGR